MLVSDRGIPLVLQRVCTVPVVTVENYCKWYNFFIVQPNGTIETPVRSIVHKAEKACANKAPTPRVDHCFHPALLEAYADLIGGEFDEQSCEMVTGRWMIEVEDNCLHDYKEQS